MFKMFSRKQTKQTKQVKQIKPINKNKQTKCQLLKSKLSPIDGLDDFDKFDFTKQTLSLQQPQPLTLHTKMCNTKIVGEYPIDTEEESDEKFSYETIPQVRHSVAVNCIEGTFTLNQKKQQIKVHLKQPKYSFSVKSVIQEKTVKSVNANCVINIRPKVFVGMNVIFPSSKLIDMTIDENESSPLNTKGKLDGLKEIVGGVLSVRHNVSAFISYHPMNDARFALYCDIPTNAYGLRMMYKFRGWEMYGNAMLRNKSFEGQFGAVKKVGKNEVKAVVSTEKKVVAQIAHQLNDNLKAIVQYQCGGIDKAKISFGFDVTLNDLLKWN